MKQFIESKHIEYKRELSDSFEKEAVAFLNTAEGGYIYIGIDADIDLVAGVPDIDRTQLQIKDRLKNNVMPSILGLFDVFPETMDHKTIIKVTLAGGSERPYYLKKYGMSEKGCFIRIGSASEPMKIKQIDELFFKRSRNTIGLMRSSQQALTFQQLKIFYQESGFDLNENFAQTLELLNPDNFYNYAAYLLSDSNGISIKVAKYSGTDRVDLIENNEYGYCCLLKATQRVLDKMDIENRTFTKITAKSRLQKRMIDENALREAVINAIIHNDYSYESPPKFEFFSDRIEITSVGSLPTGISVNDFFSGMSIPRNKELMRVFKDMKLVEHLGSGIPRILKSYDRSCFEFGDNYLRIVFKYEEGYQLILGGADSEGLSRDQAGTKLGPSEDERRLLELCQKECALADLMVAVNRTNKSKFREALLNPLLERGWLEMTLPKTPKNPKQKYRLTEIGKTTLGQE